MTKMIKKRLIFLFLLMLSPSLVWAIESPIVMLQSVSDQMIAALKEHKNEVKQDPQYVYQLTQTILVPHVDEAAMSRLALGRAPWLSATPEQREAFKKNFLDLMIRTYSSALSAYTDEEIKFKPLRVNPSERDRLQIDSVILQRGGPAIPVTYRLLKRDEEWKVYDMTVDGVSMVQSFHSQFANQLAKGNMDSLLEAMRKHMAPIKN